MKRNMWRLGVALVISTVCFLGTMLWYESGKRVRVTDGKVSVAKLFEASNEVQRKEVKRVIWESVTRNEEFYPGEAIRTTANAEAKIQLSKSGTIIHLEPDSLVVLEENENGLALDFLQGNLFVQGGDGAAADDITLKTGSGEIKLKSADMSLSKDQSGQVALEVFKGQAELKQGSQKLDLTKDKAAVLTDKGVSESKDRLTLLAPQPGETILLNLTKGEKVEMNWKPLPEGYKVFAEVGATRTALSKLSEVSAAGETGKAVFSQKPGKWFLRVYATSEDAAKPQLASMVIPFTVEPKAAPSLLEPAADTPLLKGTPEQAVEFKWLNRNKYASQLIEISKDARFTDIAVKQALDGETVSFTTPVADGSYFWRVTGYLKIKDKTEGLSSTPHKLDVTSKWEIKPATLTSPQNFSQVSYFDAQKNGVTLKWQAPPGVKRFKVLAQRRSESGWKTLYDQETEATVVKLTDVRPGGHQWKVTSLDPKGGPGKDSPVFEFSVDEMPKVEWASSEKESDYIYSTPTPTLSAQWKPLATGATSYRYRVSPEALAIEETPWSNTKQTQFDVNVKEDGRYTAIVEAINGKGQAIAQSEVKIFHVKRLPLLPPPQWLSGTPETFKSDGKGNLSFSWEEVEGAKQYMLILENPKGEVVDTRSVTKNSASLNRLKPGQYQVKLRAVDSYRRPSSEGQPKKIEVPNTSDIAAPKIKAMKVK